MFSLYKCVCYGAIYGVNVFRNAVQYLDEIRYVYITLFNVTHKGMNELCHFFLSTVCSFSAVWCSHMEWKYSYLFFIFE